MSAVASIEITGIAELRAKLEPEAFREVFVSALRDALQPVVRAASALAPRGKTGKLAGSIRARIGARRGSALSAAIVAGTGYGHLVEYGHRLVSHDVQQGALVSITTVSIRGASRGLNLGQRVSVRAGRMGGVRGRQIGQVPPHPFARPAWEAQQVAVAQLIEQRLAAAIAG